MAGLNEREDKLTQIKVGVKRDIRSVESKYLKRRALIRKNTSDEYSDLLNSLKCHSANNRVKKMKKLDTEK